jgi:hypothetical protein
MRARSCSGFSATTSWAVEQLGLAMMFFLIGVLDVVRVHFRHDERDVRVHAEADELSMTIGPAAPIFGAHSFENVPETLISTRSTVEKSNCSTSSHLTILSPN